MTRALLIFTLCAQILAINPAFAAARCPHAAMGATAQQAMRADTPQHQPPASSAPTDSKNHCHCRCNVAGHCGGSAGTVQTLPTAADGFPLISQLAATGVPGTARAHKAPLYRPPSSL